MLFCETSPEKCKTFGKDVLVRRLSFFFPFYSFLPVRMGNEKFNSNESGSSCVRRRVLVRPSHRLNFFLLESLVNILSNLDVVEKKK